MMTGAMLSILILPSVSSLAYTQYIPSSGQTGLDDYLTLSKERVMMTGENPHTSSGTPMFALDEAVGRGYYPQAYLAEYLPHFLPEGTKENMPQ